MLGPEMLSSSINFALRKIFILSYLSCFSCFADDQIGAKLGEVSVKISTHNIPDNFRPAAGSSVLYFYGLKTLIINIEIFVLDSRIIVPLEVFIGLGDPVLAKLIPLKKGAWQLVIQGGDASSVYCAKIDFDKQQVRAEKIFDTCYSKKPYVLKSYPSAEVL